MKGYLTGIVLMLGIIGTLISGCGKQSYNVDYAGRKDMYKGAKDSYKEGTKVRLIYDIIATDTDYSFRVEGADADISYNDAEGYVIEFVMPANDVVVDMNSHNSMEYVPDNGELEIIELDGDGTYVDPVSPEESWDPQTILGEAGAEALENYRTDIDCADCLLAVAHVGWSGTYSQVDIQDLLASLKDIYSDYAFMGELENCEFISQPGEEVYVIIPGKADYSMAIYEVIWGDATKSGMPERGELLYQARPGEIVVVRGNESDIVPNLEIDVNDGELVYSPSLSLENGKLTVIEGIIDFSRTEPEDY